MPFNPRSFERPGMLNKLTNTTISNSTYMLWSTANNCATCYTWWNIYQICEEEKVCSKESALNRRMNMPTSFSCIFRVRAHVKKLAYKHKLTVYLRDRSLEGSFCPTGKWHSDRKEVVWWFPANEFQRFLCILSVVVTKLLYEKYSKPHMTLESVRIVSNLYKLDQTFRCLFSRRLAKLLQPLEYTHCINQFNYL